MVSDDAAPSPYKQLNAAIRIEQFDEVPEAEYEVAIRGFLRRCGLRHLHSERLDPTLNLSQTTGSTAQAFRQWLIFCQAMRSHHGSASEHPGARRRKLLRRLTRKSTLPWLTPP